VFKNIQSRRENKCHYYASRSHVTFSAASLLTQLRFLLMRNDSTPHNLHFLLPYIHNTFPCENFFHKLYLVFIESSRNCLLGHGKHVIFRRKKSSHIIDDDNCSVFCQIFIIGCLLKKKYVTQPIFTKTNLYCKLSKNRSGNKLHFCVKTTVCSHCSNTFFKHACSS
jgi:hypothetical protein